MNSPLNSEVMLFKGLIGCIYRSLQELCLTPAVKSVQHLNKDLPDFQADSKLTQSSRATTMIYSQKLYNPPSCVAWLGNMTRICGQRAKFPSCLVRRIIVPCCH